MSENLIDENQKSSNIFNALSFERKLVELVEELRMRRNLESETEKALEVVMDEKHKEELSWDEQKRILQREKDSLEQQIVLLKRKLEDKSCISDDKAKLQVMNKTYSQEIKVLKEELRSSKYETSNLQKAIQELEGKLNLHTKFQESIVNQISDVRKSMKCLIQESQELASDQKNVLEYVAKAKYLFKKYELNIKHLQESVEVVHKINDTLKKELISCRCELSLLKSSCPTEVKKPTDNLEIEKLQKKILERDELLLLSRKENEKTLFNFLESNKLLCKFMEKYSEMQEREKASASNYESCKRKLEEAQRKLQEFITEMDVIKEMAEKEKERKEKMYSSETQTEENLFKCCTCFHGSHEDTSRVVQCVDESLNSSNDFVENVRNNLMELQKCAVIRQSEMHSLTDHNTSSTSSLFNAQMNFQSVSKHPISLSSSAKSLEFTEILKRKIEVMNSGDERESVFVKRMLVEISQNDSDEGKSEETYVKIPLGVTLENNVNEQKCEDQQVATAISKA